MCECFWKGILFIIIGLAFLLYLLSKPEKNKKPWDVKGYLGAAGFVVLGIYLIYESLILKNCC